MQVPLRGTSCARVALAATLALALVVPGPSFAATQAADGVSVCAEP